MSTIKVHLFPVAQIILSLSTHLFPALALIGLVPAGLLLARLPVNGGPLVLHDGDLTDPFLDK